MSGLLGTLRPRPCPVCGSTDDGDVFAEQHIDEAALDAFAFASRKRPEQMRLRLVTCPVCDLVYANPVPDADRLAAAYEDAAFDSAEEARFAAATYAEITRGLLDRLPDRDGAIDIGTGEGAFLSELLDLGFTNVAGIEPSSEPIAAADPRVAGLIEHDVFRADVRPPESQSLITCFQTIEHVHDPSALVRDAAAQLKPGGILLLVCHDREAPINRALGVRSPIVDIEHMQLFSKRSAGELLLRGGLERPTMRPIRNRYPIRYWARLVPLPDAVHGPLTATLERSGVAGRSLTVPVGNLAVWGFKPA